MADKHANQPKHGMGTETQEKGQQQPQKEQGKSGQHEQGRGGQNEQGKNGQHEVRAASTAVNCNA
jgi:hypothetical protein